MKKVKVLVFASLSEQLSLSECEVPWADGMTVQTVWAHISNNRPVPSNLLCSLNMDLCKLPTTVNAGDEVGFFPPVSGG